VFEKDLNYEAEVALQIYCTRGQSGVSIAAGLETTGDAMNAAVGYKK